MLCLRRALFLAGLVEEPLDLQCLRSTEVYFTRTRITPPSHKFEAKFWNGAKIKLLVKQDITFNKTCIVLNV